MNLQGRGPLALMVIFVLSLTALVFAFALGAFSSYQRQGRLPAANFVSRGDIDRALARRDYEAAIPQMRMYYRVNFGLPERYVLEKCGDELFAQEEYEEALRLYRDALALDDAAVLHRKLGAAMWNQERVTEAIHQLELATQLDPTDSAAPCLLGKVMEATGNLEDAERWYKKSIEIDGDFEEAKVRLAVVQRQLKENSADNELSSR